MPYLTNDTSPYPEIDEQGSIIIEWLHDELNRLVEQTHDQSLQQIKDQKKVVERIPSDDLESLSDELEKLNLYINTHQSIRRQVKIESDNLQSDINKLNYAITNIENELVELNKKKPDRINYFNQGINDYLAANKSQKIKFHQKIDGTEHPEDQPHFLNIKLDDNSKKILNELKSEYNEKIKNTDYQLNTDEELQVKIQDLANGLADVSIKSTSSRMNLELKKNIKSKESLEEEKVKIDSDEYRIKKWERYIPEPLMKEVVKNFFSKAIPVALAKRFNEVSDQIVKESRLQYMLQDDLNYQGGIDGIKRNSRFEFEYIPRTNQDQDEPDIKYTFPKNHTISPGGKIIIRKSSNETGFEIKPFDEKSKQDERACQYTLSIASNETIQLKELLLKENRSETFKRLVHEYSDDLLKKIKVTEQESLQQPSIGSNAKSSISTVEDFSLNNNTASERLESTLSNNNNSLFGNSNDSSSSESEEEAVTYKHAARS